MSYVRQISAASRRLGTWPVALVACLVLAAAVLAPGLGEMGLWEPQERSFADRVALPQDVEAERALRQVLSSAPSIVELARPRPPGMSPAPPPPPGAECSRATPVDAVARTLTPRALKAGRDHLGDDDTGRRLPLVVLGVLAVLATAGTAMRLAGARAGLLAAIVVLSMPLLVLQARMLTSELGAATGAALIVYGLTALARPAGGRRLVVRAADALTSAAALALGVGLGFLGGGALLGVAVPLGAVAAAGGLGVPAVIAAGRRRWGSLGRELPALWATLAAAAVLALLAWQLYDVRDPYPGIIPQARQIFGRAIVPEGCWSWALGGVWRPEDDLRFIYDSSFEQIAYGTFPWGVLAPIAMAGLLREGFAERRRAGGLALAWAGAAWIANEAFQRKVGFAIWAGFPALALAVGVWLDGLLARPDEGAGADGGGGGGAGSRSGERGAGPAMAGAVLVGLFFVLATIDLGKDMYSFPEKITSLLTGGETTVYPKPSRLLFVPTRLWPLLLGALIALGASAGLVAWRPGRDPAARRLRRLAARATAVSIAASVAAAAFWAFAWQPALARYLSSKTIFETYRELRRPGDELVIMGDLGQAPRAYAGACNSPPQLPPVPAGEPQPPPPQQQPQPPQPQQPQQQPQPPQLEPTCQQRKLEIVQSRDYIVRALKRPTRVFAVAPQSELCSLHREIGEQPYFVLEERNLRSLLLSNRIDGATDRNPLSDMIVHAEPKGIPNRPKSRVVFDGKIELLGWDLPAEVDRGESFEITLYYKILQPVGMSWKSFMHFDGSAGRAGNADHEPIAGRCSTSTWQPGDFIIDRFNGSAGSGAYPPGRLDVWIGFFTGSSPSFRNMTISEAPADLRDQHDRIKLTGLVLD